MSSFESAARLHYPKRVHLALSSTASNCFGSLHHGRSSVRSMIYRILQMIDSGLADYWRRKHWPSISGQCSNNHDLTSKNQPRPMALGDLQSAFYVLIMGYSLGLLAFVAEFFRRTEWNSNSLHHLYSHEKISFRCWKLGETRSLLFQFILKTFVFPSQMALRSDKPH